MVTSKQSIVRLTDLFYGCESYGNDNERNQSELFNLLKSIKLIFALGGIVIS